METYKSFLIYPNLRAYLDEGGNMRPMFVHTEFKTIEEAKARIDKYWLEWDQWLSRQKVNLAASFEILKADLDNHDEQQEQDRQTEEDKMSQYYLIEHENLNGEL